MEQRYYRAKNGTMYSADPATYAYLRKFLAVFDAVTVLARVRETDRDFSEAERAEGPHVDFAPLPDFRSPLDCLAHAPRIRNVTQEAVQKTDAVLVRMPGVVSEVVRRVVVARRAQYGVHVVGDPQEVFAPTATKGALRPFYRWFFTRQVERACRQEANAVAYVSRNTLPQRYPAGQGVPTFVLSNVDLHGAIASTDTLARRLERLGNQSPLHIGVVSYLDARYKGIDLLLEALAHCRSHLNLRCTIAGDGILKRELIELTEKLGLTECVKFAGHLSPGREVFDFLDTVDLYVQPSRTEGLPRALIEAMARGCPAIGTRVGGIPQLLSAGELVPSNDAAALAEKLVEIGGDAERMRCLVRANVESAREYDGPAIDAIRVEFLKAIRERSAVNLPGAACACAE
jgi:glycosyltransferase involved in cell wall biosynthesis